MYRPLRIEYPSVYYHVMNRALSGQAVFFSEPDFKGYFNLIEDTWRRWDIRLFSCRLMDTHLPLTSSNPAGQPPDSNEAY